MSVWRYRDEAIRHGWEFLDLAHEKDKAQLFDAIKNNPNGFEEFLFRNQMAIMNLVEATPSRRPAQLRRLAPKDDLTQLALILGAWQHCRKAVLAYDWLMDHESRFTPGRPYRKETAATAPFRRPAKACYHSLAVSMGNFTLQQRSCQKGALGSSGLQRNDGRLQS